MGTIAFILLILALAFCILSFVNGSVPWLGIAVLFVILALLLPKFGIS